MFWSVVAFVLVLLIGYAVLRNESVAPTEADHLAADSPSRRLNDTA